MVRTDGTPGWPCSMSARWMARAPNSPRSLRSLSSRRNVSTRSSTATSVRRIFRGTGGRLLQSTRSKARSRARRTHHWTMHRLIPYLRATDRIEAPCRTAVTIACRLPPRPILFYPSLASTMFFQHYTDLEVVAPP